MDYIERTFLAAIWYINVVIISWAVCAAVVLFCITFYAGFFPTTIVKLPEAGWWFLFLCGAVPIGLSLIGAAHFLAHRIMRSLSAEHNGVLRFNKKAPAEKLQGATEALRARLRKIRDERG